MKRLIIATCAALALTACTGSGLTSLPTSPAAVANKTVLDEQAMLAAELAYKAARVAVETGVDAGLIKGATAAKVATLDNKAYAALQTVRAAYVAGNSSDYIAAVAEARGAITDLLALTGKGA